MGGVETSRDEIYGELEEGLSYSGGEINIVDPQGVLVEYRSFCPVVTELVNNCLTKGAREVKVIVSSGKIVVEDDVFHTPDELESILANVTSDKPQTTKKLGTETGNKSGGIGIITVRHDLSRYGGMLNYEPTENGRIIAIANWPVDSEQPMT